MYKYYYFAPCKAGLVGGYVLAVLKDVKRLVVKVGTSTLVYDNGKTNIRRMHKLISVLSDIENSGIKVTLVSSGAIGVGTGKLGLQERVRQLHRRYHEL
mgnify:CR=1 FL=1